MARELTKEQAIAAVSANSWTEVGDDSACGHRGCKDHAPEERQMLESTSSVDFLLVNVVNLIQAAESINWAPGTIGPSVLTIVSGDARISFPIYELPVGVGCYRCQRSMPVGECCSSHKKQLCHGCYRQTHFVEICVDGCQDCSDENLQKIMKAGNS